MQDLTPELIALVIGALLSLLATYVPGFNSWFAGLAEDVKKSIMGLAMVVTGIVIYVLACTPSLGFPYVACPTGGVWSLFAIIVGALAGNQVTDRVSPEPQRVKAAKIAAKAAVK